MKKILFFVIFIALSQYCQAQDFEGYYTASFDFNQPLSNKKLINTTSIGGIKVGYHRLINKKFSLGGELNWCTYKQAQPTTTFTSASGGKILTTDYFNYVYAYGFVLSGRYYRSYNRKVNPYVGVGLGGAYNKYTMFYNVNESQEKKGGFLVRPEAGLMIRFNQRKSVCGLIGVHYDYSTTAKPGFPFTNLSYTDFTNYGINVGVVFLDW